MRTLGWVLIIIGIAGTDVQGLILLGALLVFMA